MTKTKSSFTIVKHDEQRVFIVDNDSGGMSVTNDAEAVCQFLQEYYPDRRFIYRDSEMQWSELAHLHGTFRGYRSFPINQVPDEVYKTP